ncbi:hypothetical protein Nepgr_009779 [Nepenthes gracilis]|uniref:Uncharacterized protein n=1 Tax=Nepenthes gracilis TaxID=150966 RepID=A0AAD3SC06_NEPGR|nr:hypothetical protein Nepgr_009779 [Nepenthes gracilis]
MEGRVVNNLKATLVTMLVLWVGMLGDLPTAFTVSVFGKAICAIKCAALRSDFKCVGVGESACTNVFMEVLFSDTMVIGKQWITRIFSASVAPCLPAMI